MCGETMGEFSCLLLEERYCILLPQNLQVMMVVVVGKEGMTGPPNRNMHEIRILTARMSVTKQKCSVRLSCHQCHQYDRSLSLECRSNHGRSDVTHARHSEFDAMRSVDMRDRSIFLFPSSAGDDHVIVVVRTFRRSHYHTIPSS
jgi:hypothetical protein